MSEELNGVIEVGTKWYYETGTGWVWLGVMLLSGLIICLLSFRFLWLNANYEPGLSVFWRRFWGIILASGVLLGSGGLGIGYLVVKDQDKTGVLSPIWTKTTIQDVESVANRGFYQGVKNNQGLSGEILDHAVKNASIAFYDPNGDDSYEVYLKLNQVVKGWRSENAGNISIQVVVVGKNEFKKDYGNLYGLGDGSTYQVVQNKNLLKIFNRVDVYSEISFIAGVTGGVLLALAFVAAIVCSHDWYLYTIIEADDLTYTDAS
ncbi:hypothetical protein ABEX45_00440 [Bacillus subtilis]